MRVPGLLVASVAFPALALGAALAGSDAISAHRCATHPMRYFLSLPTAWSAGKEWPVLVVIPDASRQFRTNLEQFVAARGNRPYILVAPEVLTCGGANGRVRELYSYSQAEWDSLRGGDDFAFEDEGMQAVLADVHRNWRGAPKAFLTGWEAGGHTVWALAFRHPERWQGVAPVTPNYQRRGVDSRSFSHAPERAVMPIQPLICGAPTGDGIRAAPYARQQTDVALGDAREHGFLARPLRAVPNRDHGPLPEAVFAWCDSLRGGR